MAYIIVEPTKYPIQPKDIDASKHFFDAFGNNDKEVSAGYIVRLCQKLNGWVAFTSKQIEDFYVESGHRDGFWFNGLENNYVILGTDQKYRVTHEFVAACFKSSPVTTSCGLFSAS